MTKRRTTSGVVQVGILYVLILKEQCQHFLASGRAGNLREMRVSPECLDALNAQEDKDPDAVNIIREQMLVLVCGVL